MAKSLIGPAFIVANAKQQAVSAIAPCRNADGGKHGIPAFEGLVEVDERCPLALVGRAGNRIQMRPEFLTACVAQDMKRFSRSDIRFRQEGDPAIDGMDDQILI